MSKKGSILKIALRERKSSDPLNCKKENKEREERGGGFRKRERSVPSVLLVEGGINKEIKKNLLSNL